jgi:phage protein D
MSKAYPHTRWRLTEGSRDLTATLDPRLMQLTLTDNRGLEADQLDITLSDADGLLDIPARGAKLFLSLGREDIGLIDKGSYTVDEIEHSGAPDQLTIRARSADLRESLLVKKERSWSRTTVGAIVRKIAQENKLKPAVSTELEKLPVPHMDQQSESDANLLTRLAAQVDALCAVKAGNLIFYAIGRGMSIGGEPLPEVNITREVGDSHRFAVADRDGCAGVVAYYYNKKAGIKGEVTIREKDLYHGKNAKSKDAKKVSTTDGNKKTLRHTYPNRDAASKAASTALKKALRGVSTFSLTLAHGRPDIIPELPATVSGWKPTIDGTAWRVVKVTHSLSDSGLTTSLELELRIEAEQIGDPGAARQEEKDDD